MQFVFMHPGYQHFPGVYSPGDDGFRLSLEHWETLTRMAQRHRHELDAAQLNHHIEYVRHVSEYNRSISQQISYKV